MLFLILISARRIDQAGTKCANRAKEVNSLSTSRYEHVNDRLGYPAIKLQGGGHAHNVTTGGTLTFRMSFIDDVLIYGHSDTVSRAQSTKDNDLNRSVSIDLFNCQRVVHVHNSRHTI